MHQRSTLFALLTCFLHVLAFGQPETVNNQNTLLGTIPFELTPHNNIAFQGVLNGKDTVKLMFHTDAHAMTLTEAAASKVKSIQWDEETEVESWGGESKARYSNNNVLQVASFTWDSLAIWENKNSGPGTAGKIGPVFFAQKVIEIDFDASVIRIYKTLPKKAKRFDKLAIDYSNGSLFVEGKSFVGKKALSNKFLIHSGYGGAVLYDDGFSNANQLGEQLEILAESALKDSYGNTLKTKKAELPAFKLGDQKFKKVPVGFFEGSIGRQQISVIGGDLLKRFNIIIDAERNFIYLRSNGLKKQAYVGVG